MRATDKAPMGGGGGWGACGGYPLHYYHQHPRASQTTKVIIISLTYWSVNMDKVKSFIGSLIFMVPMLVLMLMYFDCLVP